MKKIYFITATNTNIGKTHAAEIFLKKFAAKGKKVGYYKPIETGVITKPLDGTKLLKITKKLNPEFNFSIDQVVQYQYKLAASPFVSKKNTEIKISKILSHTEKLLEKCDVLIVEGAGGLMVPILKNYFMIDLIRDFQNKYNAKAILIAPSVLGGINDTLLSIKALESHKVKYKWYINLYKNKKSFKKTTLPFYKEYFDKISFL